MLRQLPSPHDNGQSMVFTPSVSFYRIMTRDRSWLFIPNICNMLCQLSSPHDNGQSMVITPQGSNMLCQLSSSHDNGQSMVVYSSCMKYAPSVVMVSCQLSEHGYSSLMF